MSDKNFPMTLVIKSKNELDALRRAVNVQYEVENDSLLDDVISSTQKFRAMQQQSDHYISGALQQYRASTNDRIDGLLAMERLRERIEYLK